MSRDEVSALDPVGTMSAFGRAAYSDLVTVVLVSVLTALAAIPIVTFGPALVGAVAAMTTAVSAELDGTRRTERDRLDAYRRAARTNVFAAIPYGLIVLGAILATLWYLNAAYASGRADLLVAAAVGVYVVVGGLVWVLRASSLLVRAPPGEAPSSIDALRIAAHHLLETPSFSALQGVVAGFLGVLCVGLGVPVILLLPGLLALLEVVCYEERSGAGAVTVVKAYQGTLHRGEDG